MRCLVGVLLLTFVCLLPDAHCAAADECRDVDGEAYCWLWVSQIYTYCSYQELPALRRDPDRAGWCKKTCGFCPGKYLFSV